MVVAKNRTEAGINHLSAAAGIGDIIAVYSSSPAPKYDSCFSLISRQASEEEEPFISSAIKATAFFVFSQARSHSTRVLAMATFFVSAWNIP